MIEHTFDGRVGGPSEATIDRGYDFREHLDELRCRPTEWLRARRSELVREQRRLHVEELAVTRVLDERDQVDVPAVASERTARQTVETARALESLPAVAAAAHAGALSAEQLAPLTELADAGSDREWAERAPSYQPGDLSRLVRARRAVSTEDAAARREARELRWWWRRGAGMLSLRGEIPDVDGALVESVLGRMIERMRPARGEPWDTWGHRGADALVELCRSYADVEPTGRAKPHVVVHVDANGHADVNGVPLARSTVEAVLGNAVVEEVLVAHGAPLVAAPGRRTLPARLERAIRLRDPQCRWPGCERSRGLQVHHLVPVCAGGTTEPANLARVCVTHHHRLEPHGPYRLTGNPNQPDGLRLVHRDELDRLADSRAGPSP